MDALLDMLLAADDADVAPAKPPPVRNPKPGGTVGRASGSSSTSVKGLAHMVHMGHTRAGAIGAGQLTGPAVRQDESRGSRGEDVAQQCFSQQSVSQHGSRGPAGEQESRSGVVAQTGSLEQGLAQEKPKGRTVGPPQALKNPAEEELLDWLDD